MKAVALVWSDPSQFEQMLINDPHGFLDVHCNYKVPDGVTVQVKKNRAPDGPMVDAQTQLVLYLPDPPDKPEDSAVALVDYISNHHNYSVFFC